jgi:hypothetical protein
MVVGTTLFKMDGNAYFSPSFPRGGLAATFAVDVTQIAGTPSFTITVQTRNAEDTTWTDLGTFTAITATGASQKDLTGLKEIVRFKYAFDAGDDPTDGLHFLMQSPSWRPY